MKKGVQWYLQNRMNMYTLKYIHVRHRTTTGPRHKIDKEYKNIWWLITRKLPWDMSWRYGSGTLLTKSQVNIGRGHDLAHMQWKLLENTQYLPTIQYETYACTYAQVMCWRSWLCWYALYTLYWTMRTQPYKNGHGLGQIFWSDGWSQYAK